jgi:DNA-directed RNA polymerase beta' subunit
MLVSCNFFNEEGGQKFEHIPLAEYKYNQASIEPGTRMQLLGFSGGKGNDKETIYYYQFIVLNEATGDTLRILSPLISFNDPESDEKKVYTTPLQFDADKGVYQAIYERQDSSQNLILQTEALTKNGALDSSVDFQALADEIKFKQLVVINKTIPMFENPNYQTAIGILHFQEIPW